MELKKLNAENEALQNRQDVLMDMAAQAHLDLERYQLMKGLNSLLSRSAASSVCRVAVAVVASSYSLPVVPIYSLTIQY